MFLSVCLFLWLFVNCASARNYVAFSVNSGEGFVAKQLVWVRIFALFEQLVTQHSDLQWTLVMPPVCGSLRHGGDGSGATHSVATLIDVAWLQTALQRNASDAQVLTFFDFSRQRAHMGRAADVDVALHLSQQSATDYKRDHWREWPCSALVRGDVELTFPCWPLKVAELRCVDTFSNALSPAAVDAVGALAREQAPECDNGGAQQMHGDRAFALLRAETLSWGAVWFEDVLRRAVTAIRPAEQLRQVAADVALCAHAGGDAPCLRSIDRQLTQAGSAACARTVAIHWRQNDFRVHHAHTTPSVASLARFIANATAADDSTCVFLMTDAVEERVGQLRAALRDARAAVQRVVRLSNTQAALRGQLPVALLLVEMQVAIAADEFHGTPVSSVSTWITKKREARGASGHELRNEF